MMVSVGAGTVRQRIDAVSPDGNGSSNQEGREKAGNRALSSDRRLAVKRQRIPRRRHPLS
jgi:hypothetical protein